MIKTLFKIIGFLLLAITLLLSALSFYYTQFPYSEVEVILPDIDGVIKIQLWSGFTGDGRFELLIQNANGELRTALWNDWGPAQRTNFYITDEGWLAALGAGDLAALVAIHSSRPPEVITTAGREIDSNKWKYLGATDGYKLKFYSPTEKPECFETFGQFSVYRKDYQFSVCAARSP